MAAKKKAFFAKNCEKMARFQKFIVKKSEFICDFTWKTTIFSLFSRKKGLKKEICFFFDEFSPMSHP